MTYWFHRFGSPFALITSKRNVAAMVRKCGLVWWQMARQSMPPHRISDAITQNYNLTNSLQLARAAKPGLSPLQNHALDYFDLT